MKQRVLICLLLMMISTMILAIQDNGDSEEYRRKTQELNQLGERFKAETGFRGEVMHSTTTMRLHVF